MDGFFLVYKNKFMTSHDVVKKIKKKFGFLKVGHSGTLDPLAEGLLIILIGKATKLAFLFENLDKKYIGTFIFNKHFDTLDITGKIISIKNTIINDKMLEATFSQFHQKEYFQKPPMYSAVKINGQKMYVLARKNIQVNIPHRKVFIYKLCKTSYIKDDEVNFFAHVSKGTYIRSLASDIAFKISTYGAIKELKRIAIGPYLLKDSKSLTNISINNLINIKQLFFKYKQLVLDDYLVKLVKNGIYLDHRQIITDKPFIVKDNNLQWIAYYDVIDKHKYAPKFFFI